MPRSELPACNGLCGVDVIPESGDSLGNRNGDDDTTKEEAEEDT